MTIPYTTVHAGELARRTAPPSWLVEGLFLEAGAGILGGAPKSCKSFFALDLCVAVASGTSCAGFFRVISPGPIVVRCAEDPDGVLTDRLTALSRARGRQLGDLPIEILVDPVRLPDGLERLAATVAAIKPKLLLLDPLIRLHRADENSASEMSVILDGLRGLARTSKAAVLLVHHTRKAAGGSAGLGLRGSSDLHAFGDSNLYLRKLSQNAALELKIEHRADAAPAPVRLKLLANEGEPPSSRFCVLDRTTDETIARRILDLLAKSPQALTSAALRETLGLRNQTVAEALDALRTDGRIQRVGRDGWSLVRS
jgi:RecA-family ATPase